MATLTTQLVAGRNLPSLVAAAAGGDVCALDPAIKLFVTNAGGSTCNVTLTPSGPYVGADVAARVVPVAAGASQGIPVWDYPAARSSPKYGICVITYDQVVTVTVKPYVTG